MFDTKNTPCAVGQPWVTPRGAGLRPAESLCVVGSWVHGISWPWATPRGAGLRPADSYEDSYGKRCHKMMWMAAKGMEVINLIDIVAFVECNKIS